MLDVSLSLLIEASPEILVPCTNCVEPPSLYCIASDKLLGVTELLTRPGMLLITVAERHKRDGGWREVAEMVGKNR